MNLNGKVTSLALSKKLKELGVEQKSLFYWEYLDEKTYDIKYFIHSVCPLNTKPFEHFSAFTSDELMNLLPCFVDTKECEPFNNFWLEIHKRSVENIQYIIKYICDTQGIDRYGKLVTIEAPFDRIYDNKLSDALAKMIILLIEKKIYVKRTPVNIGDIT